MAEEKAQFDAEDGEEKVAEFGLEQKEQVSDALQLDTKSSEKSSPTHQVPGQSPTGYDDDEFDDDDESQESGESGDESETNDSETKTGDASLAILEQKESFESSADTAAPRKSSQDQADDISRSATKTKTPKKKSRKRVKRTRRRRGRGRRGESVPERTTSAHRRRSADEHNDEDEAEAYHSSGGGGGRSATFRTPSAHIMAKKFVERNIVKKKLLHDRELSRQVVRFTPIAQYRVFSAARAGCVYVIFGMYFSCLCVFVVSQ
jgi:hypothetical protein